MALWDRVAQFLALAPMHEFTQTRETAQDGSLEDLLTRITSRSTTQQWIQPTVREALGVPAILRACTLIANVTGSLTMRAYRQSVRLADDERPRIIVRPNPLSSPRVFFRDTAWSMATRGEAWWWIAARDIDGAPMSLYPIPPQEIVVTRNDRDLRYPVIEWRGKTMPNADMVQITLTQDSGQLRGEGPLQLCGAAVNVAVEAQEWAANFFTSPLPSVNLHSDTGMSAEEAAKLKTQFAAIAPNTPLITTGDLHLREFGANTIGGQMLDGRAASVRDVAEMFGIPGALLEYAMTGTGVTYQNVSQIFDVLLKGCLLPNYLEPVEQAMSDLLSRSTVGRFNVDALLRADIKTRFDVYESGTKSGVLTVDEARQLEGLDPGDVETAPVPFSPPQAIPTALPIQGRTSAVRCACGKLLAEMASAPYRFTCPRCKTAVAA